METISKHAYFEKLSAAKMPFGKYTGHRLVDLPEPYLIWLKEKALPAGELGKMLLDIYEIKLNGLEYLLRQYPISRSSVKKSDRRNL